MTGLPRSAAEITPAWLTAALREGGRFQDAVVEDLSVEPMASGVGFMCEVTRLRVTYRRAPTKAPATMIAKIPTQDPGVRSLIAPARVFEREGRFYQALRDHPDLAVPRCWYSGIDLEADDFVLLLEDLTGMRGGDQLAGCGPDEAAIALRAIAAFHAAFWENQTLDALDWLPALNAEINKQAGEQIYATSLPRFLEVFGAILTPEMTEIAQRFGANGRQLLDRMCDMPHTVVHFDFRLDNIFFGGEPDAPVRVFDFQAVGRGGGAYDVGYFISQSMTVEDRRSHEQDLLDVYHAALLDHGVRGYDRAALSADVRVGIMYGWIIPVWAVGGLDMSSERAVGLWTEVVRRSQTAIADHRADDLLTR